MENEVDSKIIMDLRGQMFRAKRQMPDAEARQFLKAQMTAHVGTVDANGWPYVVPLVYIYGGGDLLYLHTGAHQGHFLTNLQRDPRRWYSQSIAPKLFSSEARYSERW